MTSTVKFQIKPNFFSSEKEAKESEKKKENTNPRYKAFNQTHFTAGDVEQFETYKDPTNGLENKEIILSKENLFHDLDIPLPNFRKYENISALSVNNTFSYLFHKFKKGIFIKIKDGKLAVFLPFSKKNYTNEWSKRIKFSNDFFSNLEKLYKEETKIYFSRTSINKFPDCWYANNFLLRYEFPIHEGDTNNTIFADFFETLCKERDIPNMEFFLNRRDMPLLTMDGTEPYNHIFDSETQPLLSHNYSEYSPVLSMVSNKKFADIAIPTGDDWSRVERNPSAGGLGKFFVDTCSRSFDISGKVEWEKRIPTAVFRGASTGAGVTVETNPRLKAAYLSTLKRQENGILLLDAGITEWNLRARKLSGSPYLQTIDVKSLPFSLVPRLDPNEQVKYKYILNIPGHVAAYRLSLELFSECCILLVESESALWFTHLLKPFVHYVPVKNNLEDLFEKILWCRKNDEKAKEIAINAREFAEKYLTREGILDYTQKLLISLKEKTGVYLYPKSFSEFQRQKELEILKKMKSQKREKEGGIPVSFFVIERKYYFFHAIEWLIRKNPPKPEGELIYENKNSTIKKIDLCGVPIVIKTSKEKDLIHEAFVTLKCTNYLLEKIPNFLYCFGYRPEENLYLEYIEGETFLSFLNSSSFTIENYIFLLVQVCLALQVAQNFCGFVHNDLVPWNIILQRHENPIEINYVIGEKVYTVLSDMVPIIIDMNRSHVIYKDTHYGKVNMFSSSSIQDIITLLTTSLFEITKKDNYAKELIILANFMSGTRYRPKPFIFTGKGGLGDLRFFLNTAKKFENLVEGSKFELEEKRPIDLVNYILTNFHFSLPVKTESIYEKKISFSEGSSIQVYNYALAKNREEQLASFIEFFDGIKVKTEKNPILAYYYIQKYYSVMGIVREQLKLFDSSVKISWFRKVKEALEPVLSKKPRKLGIPVIQKHDLSLKYDEKDFYNKKKILNLIMESEKNPLNDVEILETYREMFLHLFLYDGKYSLPQEMREFCRENFSEILTMDEYKIKVFNANVKTLKIYAELC